LEDLLYAMMLRSANDTPIAGATYLTGSIDKFVDMMNDVARKAGCKDTHFVTPNGLYDPNHYSCAYDLALLARYAYNHCPMFETIVTTQRHTIDRSINVRDDVVKNTASTFLKTFPGADGVKTGYLKQAGHCFVASAKRNGWRLIAVVLDSPSCREDCIQMLSYGFNRYEPKPIAKTGTAMGVLNVSGFSGGAPVKLGQALYDVAPKNAGYLPVSTYSKVLSSDPDFTGDSIRRGEKVGIVTLLKNGKPVMTADLLSLKAISPTLLDKAGIALGVRNGHSPGIIVANVIGGLAALFVVSFLCKSIYARTNTKNHRRRRPRVSTNG
jgi:D-alanyl-D-alanine carboxypeptidase (penicillin-binding protein 5/6)